MSESDDVEILEPERGAGLFRRQRKEIEQDVLNSRGKKWFRNQLGVSTVITGVGLLAGVSAKFWLGLNLLSIPVTVYHARKEYQALAEKYRDEE